MRRALSGPGGRWIAGIVCLALVIGAWAAVASRARPLTAAGASFVSLYPLAEADELDRYSLADGRSLGVLVRIPAPASTAASSTVATPHLQADGNYLLTLDHGDVCGSSRGACHPVPDSCLSDVETLNPASGQSRLLFAVSGDWRVQDAVPSPNARWVALVEYGCEPPLVARLEVRDLDSGRSHLVTAAMSPCGLESDVTWNSGSTKLTFAYGRHPDPNDSPAGCGLVTAPVDRTTGPADWRTLSLPGSCGFESSAFDATGIVAIEGCGDGQGGTTSTLLQYGRDGRVLSRRALDSFDPPQYGLDAQLETDSAADTVLVSELVTDDPDVSDVWTFNGTTLRHVGDYFGEAILAEP